MALSRKLKALILAELSEGKSLHQICRESEGRRSRISRTAVYRELHADPQWRAAYIVARQDQAIGLADEILELADAPAPTFTDAEGCTRVDHGAVNARKLRIDARKWLAAKMYPHYFGDKIELSGVQGAPLSMMSDPIEVARRLAYILREADQAQQRMREQPQAPLALPAPGAVQ